MQRYSLFLFPFFLLSCQSNTNKDIERQHILQQARYNDSVMDHLNEYTVLKDFLVANRDTLIRFRNNLDSARPRTKEEKKRNIIRQPSDCFRFSSSNYDWELENIPAALQPAFDSLRRNVAVSGLNACQVCTHGEVEMYVKSVEGGKNIRLSHSLHWDGGKARRTGKDTIVGDCRYAIHLLVYGE